MSFFEIESGKLARVTDFKELSNDCPTFIAFFHPTQTNILISGTAGAVVFWDTESGLRLKTFKEQQRLQNPAMSSDGRWLFASLRQWETNPLRDFKIWDAQTGAVVYQSSQYLGLSRMWRYNPPVNGYFSLDNKLLAVKTEGRLTLYRIDAK